MAGYELIDAYLAGLRRRLAWCPDVDDVAAEAEDHLLSTVERLISDGATREAAQQAALGRFGNSTAVASAHAATSRGGVGMPTEFTRLAGIVAIGAAVFWTASAAMWLVDQFLDPSGIAEPTVGLLSFVTLVIAAGSTVVVVVGLNRRHGGLGPLGAIGLVLVCLGVVATLVFWFVMGWALLLAVGMLLVALAVNARGLAPTAATAAFGGAWTVGVLTWSVLRVLEVGTRDEWGDYPIVSPTAITVGVAILVPGLIGLGRWLSTETPRDLDSFDSLAAT
jgi:hypothetical protein